MIAASRPGNSPGPVSGGHAGNDDSGDPLKISDDKNLIPFLSEHRQNRFFLARPDFHNQMPSGLNEGFRTADKALDELGPLFAPDEGPARLMVADFPREIGPRRAPDIRRIRYDDVEAPRALFEGRKQVASQEPDTGDTVGGRV